MTVRPATLPAPVARPRPLARGRAAVRDTRRSVRGRRRLALG